MGGNALKHIETIRYKKEDYFKLYDEIKTIFLHRYPESENDFLLLPSYKNKPDFGDMDILINKNCCDVQWLKKTGIWELYKFTSYYNNGSCFSFNYKNFQIDFLFTKDKHLITSYDYYSYNDLGNLMGRIANKFGCRYGHMGLEKKLYTEDRTKLLDVFHLSSDVPLIFNFLGFDYATFLLGFDELEDIFKYVINSKYFNKELFPYENLDHQNRTRNKKRKTYQQFLSYIENIDTAGFEFSKDRDVYLNRINEFFPDVGIFEKIQTAKEREKIKKEIKQKFNGNIVSEVTGLQGKELGKFISMFKKSKENFDEYVLSYYDEMVSQIQEAYILYENNKNLN